MFETVQQLTDEWTVINNWTGYKQGTPTLDQYIRGQRCDSVARLTPRVSSERLQRLQN